MNKMKNLQPEGNYYPKYTSENVLVKKIMKGFFTAIESTLAGIAFSEILDAGCGEGYVSNFVQEKFNVPIDAFDTSEKVINEASSEFPKVRFCVNSIYDSKIHDESYDLVICMEVLEHLEKPQKGVEELFRIARKYVLVSVPNEPIWRISNFLRGKYLKQLGNTPGHINHWSSKEFETLCSSYGEIVDKKTPFPWTMLLLSKKN